MRIRREGASGRNVVPARPAPSWGARWSSAAVLALMVLAGCAGAPRVVSYYVDRGILQYYLMPSTFLEDHARLSLDITVRIGGEAEPPAICNFTISDRELPREVLEAAFELTDLETILELRDFGVLYVDRGRGEIRLTSTLDLESVRRLLRSEDLTLRVRTDRRLYHFRPTQRFYKTARDARIEIVDAP